MTSAAARRSPAAAARRAVGSPGDSTDARRLRALDNGDPRSSTGAAAAAAQTLAGRDGAAGGNGTMSSRSRTRRATLFIVSSSLSKPPWLVDPLAPRGPPAPSDVGDQITSALPAP